LEAPFQEKTFVVLTIENHEFEKKNRFFGQEWIFKVEAMN